MTPQLPKTVRTWFPFMTADFRFWRPLWASAPPAQAINNNPMIRRWLFI
jgi:hypothetical protein